MKKTSGGHDYSFKKAGQAFEEMHISMVWEELQELFGFNIKEWKKVFNRYLEQQPRNVDVISAFFRFGNANINPVLNQILSRNSGYPTWNNFCATIFRKRKDKVCEKIITRKRYSYENKLIFRMETMIS